MKTDLRGYPKDISIGGRMGRGWPGNRSRILTDEKRISADHSEDLAACG